MNDKQTPPESKMATEHWKAKLQRWCQTNHKPLPTYTNERDIGGRWTSTVVIDGNRITGDPKSRKVDADMSAAELAYINVCQPSPSRSRPVIQDASDSDDGLSEILLENPRPSRRNTRRDSPRPSHVVSHQRTSLDELELKMDARLPPRRPTGDDLTFRMHDGPVQHNHRLSQFARQREPGVMGALFQSIMGDSPTSATFANNPCDLDMMAHLQMIVRNKPVEITNNPSYPIRTAPVVLYLLPSQENTVRSVLTPQGVKITIPAMPISRMPYQANVWLVACMELGATSVAIIDTNFAVSIPTSISMTAT